HRDVSGGEADHLPVAPDLLARAPRVPRHLVAGTDVLPHLDAAARVLEHGARGNLLLGDGHVVSLVEDEGDVGDGIGSHACSSYPPWYAGQSTGRPPTLQIHPFPAAH